MSFSRFVEIGRVALINYGPDEGKLCTIVDVVDHNRVSPCAQTFERHFDLIDSVECFPLQALIDGPTSLTGVHRQQINFKRLSLTDFKVDIGRNSRQKKLCKEWNKADILEKWNKTSWSKRLERRRTRRQMTDMDRFKAMIQQKEVCMLL